MSREIFVYDKVTNKVVNRDLLPPRETSHGVIIMPDIAPYKSMVTGEMIGGRSQHREHLKQHNLVEVAGERIKPPDPWKSPPGLKEVLYRACDGETF